MLKRLNDVLPELVLEILAWGLLVQLVGVWFVADKLRYTTGLWIGIAAAIGMAIHMAVVIHDTVDMMAEKRARVRATVFSLLRYIVLAALFAVVLYFHLGSIIPMFLGVMGLKVAAYLQPFMHKFITRVRR